MTDLERICHRIAELTSELAELETAARVLRNLPLVSSGHKEIRSTTKRRKKPSGRLTITRAAETILSEQGGGPAHYKAVAKRAVEMGYRGKSTSTAEKREKAFWATMKRQPERFKSLGDGRFKLRRQAE